MSEMRKIRNPILKGFNPDPSIVRVGEMYYIATSTFEWFPGVQIYASRDLDKWELIGHPLDRVSQLNMLGNPDSGGIYAPCLTWHDGLFYLVYTNCRNLSGRYWDCSNYLVTSPGIEGPWSEPVYLNGTGIDPSLFHDDDGRKWLVNVVLSYQDGGKPGFPKWDGIVLQEYSPKEKRLIGEPAVIFEGSPLGTTEGPHLYKRKGYYYLMTAEGGTFYNHAITMARSKTLTGPYEIDPENPVMTSRYDCTLPLQRTGHGDLVETEDGEWYMVHLCGRPLPSRGRSVMGRETGIQKMAWTEAGWLRLKSGKHVPEEYVEGLGTGAEGYDGERDDPEDFFDDFNRDVLDVSYQTLRIPLGEDMMSLTERKGWLRLKGHESLSSHHYQSMVARRQQEFNYTAETRIDFHPESFMQQAGLACYYDTTNYIYLYISCNKRKRRIVNLLINDLNRFSFPVGEGIEIPDLGDVFLQVSVSWDAAYFSFSMDGVKWEPVGGYVEYSKLSDEYFKERGMERFTGTFAGICCQDFTGKHITADFDYFRMSGEQAR